MVMELGHLNQSLYPRAIKPSVEGQIRQEGQGGITPDPASAVKKGAADAIHRHQSQQARRDETDRRITNEQTVQRHAAEHGHELGGYSEASSVGDQLAVASRQARQTQARRGYSPPALLSSRGREANRRYLDATLSNQPRFIDELV